MKKLLIIISIGFGGAITGLVTWIIAYLARQTPVIGFDGPAAFLATVAAFVGLMAGLVLGLLLTRRHQY